MSQFASGTLPTPQRVADLLSRFATQHVVVVGDMVADEYVIGTPARISREAPVVILEYHERRLVPGGATNVAANVRALGASVGVVGVIGDDQIGRELVAAMLARRIDISGLVVDPTRPTSTKTRIIGGGTQVVQQQMVRIDRVDSRALDGSAKPHVLQVANEALLGAQGMILSDYEHGVLDPDVIHLCLSHAEANSEMISTVDAHGDLYRFRGVSLATPNQPEAEATLGRALHGSEELRQGGEELIGGMQAQGLLITRGGLGMVVIDPHGLYLEIPPLQVAEVRDATGAGDTVAATATLALAAGASLLEAAVLSTIAAGLVVRRFGAATTTPDELLAAVRNVTS
jgi:rfaE bifunctional protein kinase chain/domain